MWVWDQNHVFLLHRYENLCFYLHKYFFTLLFFICNYYATPFFYHRFHIIINYAKTIEDENLNSFYNSISWNFIFIQQLVLLKWRCFQRLQTFIYILTKKKLNKKFLELYVSHGFLCDSTCTIMWKKLFTWIIMCESMHINVTKTFHINYHVWVQMG
jgi:hypothetical protein